MALLTSEPVFSKWISSTSSADYDKQQVGEATDVLWSAFEKLFKYIVNKNHLMQNSASCLDLFLLFLIGIINQHLFI